MPAPLARETHIVRFVYKNKLRRNENDEVIGVLPQGLQPRERDKYLSVTSVEFFNADYEQGLSAAVEAIRNQLSGIGRKDGFTTGNVGAVHEACGKHKTQVRIITHWSPANHGHSGIHNLPRDNIELLDLLALEVFTDTRLSESFG